MGRAIVCTNHTHWEVSRNWIIIYDAFQQPIGHLHCYKAMQTFNNSSLTLWFCDRTNCDLEITPWTHQSKHNYLDFCIKKQIYKLNKIFFFPTGRTTLNFDLSVRDSLIAFTCKRQNEFITNPWVRYSFSYWMKQWTCWQKQVMSAARHLNCILADLLQAILYGNYIWVIFKTCE